jgi:tetratricopeptide (TPR) repeat protein
MPTTATRAPAWRWQFLLVVSVLLAYANMWWGSFQFDDFNVIVNYGPVHSWSAFWADLPHGLRPLLKLSYTLNWTLDNREVGFHAFNLLVHLTCAVLVGALSGRLLGMRDATPVPTRQFIAASVALLFALHPAQTEAVTYISGRSSSLMTLFYLAALLAHDRAAAALAPTWQQRLASPLLFVLAIGAKETALTLPAALLLWDWCAGRPLSLRALWQRLGGHAAVTALAALALVMHPRYQQLLHYSVQLHSPLENVLTQLHAMSYLLSQWFFPWCSNIDPDLPIVKTWSAAGPDALLWIGLAGVAILGVRRSPGGSFAVLWFVLQLLPIYVFLPRVDIANDRQLYLAAWPLLVPVCSLCVRGIALQRVRLAALVSVALGLATLTLLQNQNYRTEQALWKATVRCSPNKPRPYNNLGYAHFLQGDEAAAERNYRRALEVDPDYWMAQANLDLLQQCRQQPGSAPCPSTPRVLVGPSRRLTDGAK